MEKTSTQQIDRLDKLFGLNLINFELSSSILQVPKLNLICSKLDLKNSRAIQIQFSKARIN